MMTRIRIWRDGTMATRMSRRYMLIHLAMMVASATWLFCISIIAGQVIAEAGGLNLIHAGVLYIPAFVILIIAACNYADEVRFLRSNKEEA